MPDSATCIPSMRYTFTAEKLGKPAFASASASPFHLRARVCLRDCDAFPSKQLFIPDRTKRVKVYRKLFRNSPGRPRWSSFGINFKQIEICILAGMEGRGRLRRENRVFYRLLDRSLLSTTTFIATWTYWKRWEKSELPRIGSVEKLSGGFIESLPFPMEDQRIRRGISAPDGFPFPFKNSYIFVEGREATRKHAGFEKYSFD